MNSCITSRYFPRNLHAHANAVTKRIRANACSHRASFYSGTSWSRRRRRRRRRRRWEGEQALLPGGGGTCLTLFTLIWVPFPLLFFPLCGTQLHLKAGAVGYYDYFVIGEALIIHLRNPIALFGALLELCGHSDYLRRG